MHLNKEKFAIFAKDFSNKILSKDSAIIFLKGEIGAGKTYFVQRCLEEYNLEITSPTFTILNEYQIKINNQIKKIFHIDLYRLEQIYSLDEIFDFDYYKDNAIIFIEWPERLKVIEKTVDFCININSNNKDEYRSVLVEENYGC